MLDVFVKAFSRVEPDKENCSCERKRDDSKDFVDDQRSDGWFGSMDEFRIEGKVENKSADEGKIGDVVDDQ